MLCQACPGLAVVQWSRRPTDAELGDICAAEQARRDQVMALADPSLPAPVFGPMPVSGDFLIAVFACADHALSLASAALVHASDCAAPPICACKPEAVVIPPPASSPSSLPDGWQ